MIFLKNISNRNKTKCFFITVDANTTTLNTFLLIKFSLLFVKEHKKDYKNLEDNYFFF